MIYFYLSLMFSKSVRGITIGRLTHGCHPIAFCYCSFSQMLSQHIDISLSCQEKTRKCYQTVKATIF